jgi:hypothetical protein
MGSVAMRTYQVQKEIGSGIQKLLGDTQTHRQGGDRISLLQESRLLKLLPALLELQRSVTPDGLA